MIFDTKVEIEKELPKFMADLIEFQYIMKTEDIELQLLYLKAKKELYNTFITTCDVDMLRYFEKLVGITSNETMAIETRRNQILMKWLRDLPYTYKNLIKKLDFVQGRKNYVITPNFNKYELNLDLIDTDFSKTDLLKSMINKWIPCNISVTINNKNYRESKLELPSIIYVRDQITNVISMRDFDLPQYNSNLKIGMLGMYKKVNELSIREI